LVYTQDDGEGFPATAVTEVTQRNGLILFSWMESIKPCGCLYLIDEFGDYVWFIICYYFAEVKGAVIRGSCGVCKDLSVEWNGKDYRKSQALISSSLVLF
jgi:hypothetical protein